MIFIVKYYLNFIQGKILYRYFIFTILALFIFIGCGSKNLLEDSHALKAKEEKMAQKSPRVYKNISFEYKIAKHDRVQITVYNHPELSTASAEGMNSRDGILVDSRGIVSLPLIGAVRIAGLTQPSASRKIQSLYGKYLKKSSVHVEVLNKQAFIVGEVTTPGIVKLPNEQTALLQAIASVGGFKDTANQDKIIIIRKSARGSKIEVANLTNLTSLSHSTMMIRPNDIIYVTPSKMKSIVLPAASIFKLVADALLPFVRYQDLTD